MASARRSAWRWPAAHGWPAAGTYRRESWRCTLPAAAGCATFDRRGGGGRRDHAWADPVARAEAPPLQTVAVDTGTQERPGPRSRGMAAGRVFHLQVVAADTRKPVSNADVRVWIAFRDEWRKTDAEGRIEIVHSTGPSDRQFAIDVWGEGLAMQRHGWGDNPNEPIPDGEMIALQPGESLGGVIQDEQGRPIGGATVLLWSHNYTRKDSHELLYDLRAVTGADGRWRTSGRRRRPVNYAASW